MNQAKQATYCFIALLLMACLAWYTASSSMEIISDDSLLSKTADVTVEQLTVHQYNQAGQLAHSLETVFLRHIPANDTHYLQTPNIMISQTNQAAWTIQSGHAVASNHGTIITFHQHVVIHQNASANNLESSFNTEEITYFPKEKKAVSTKDICFKQPGNLVESKGMNAYFDEKRIQLLSHARGRYESNHA